MKEKWACPDYFPEDWVDVEALPYLNGVKKLYADGTEAWIGHKGLVETVFSDGISIHFDAKDDLPPNYFPKDNL